MAEPNERERLIGELRNDFQYELGRHDVTGVGSFALSTIQAALDEIDELRKKLCSYKLGTIGTVGDDHDNDRRRT